MPLSREVTHGLTLPAPYSVPSMLSASKRNRFIELNTRDWNAEFQTALEAPEGLEKCLALKSIAYDFVDTATTYGKVRLGAVFVCEISCVEA